MLSALLWDDDQACRMEAACALSALTSSHDEAVCAAVKAAGGIPRLVGLVGVPGSSDGSNGRINDGSSGVDDSSAGLLGVPGSSDGSNVGVDGSSNGGAGGSSVQQLGMPGNKDTNNSDNISGAGADCSSGSDPVARRPASCIKTNGNAVCIGDNNTSANDPNSDPAAAAAPDACAALTSAAVTVLGNLAAGSAERRALIATTSGALPGIVACLGSNECSCRVAALQALLHITASEPWRLADGLVLAQVKAAGRLGGGGGAAGIARSPVAWR
jgi:hypothetical protein